ncbi:MAG: hypothetical protein KA785_04245 [Spirochaetaceae bacterium]|nr:hypothetical protein [Spirochaetaceae bacterium]
MTQIAQIESSQVIKEEKEKEPHTKTRRRKGRITTDELRFTQIMFSFFFIS